MGLAVTQAWGAPELGLEAAESRLSHHDTRQEPCRHTWMNTEHSQKNSEHILPQMSHPITSRMSAVIQSESSHLLKRGKEPECEPEKASEPQLTGRALSMEPPPRRCPGPAPWTSQAGQQGGSRGKTDQRVPPGQARPPHPCSLSLWSQSSSQP